MLGNGMGCVIYVICASAYLAIRVFGADSADRDGVSARVLGRSRLISVSAEAVRDAPRGGVGGLVGRTLVPDARPAPESRAAGLTRLVRGPVVAR